MKKILAVLLATLLVLVNVAALAENVNIIEKQKLPTKPESFELTKTYTTDGPTAINPADELEFTVSAAARTQSSEDFTTEQNTEKRYPVGIENVTVAQGDGDATITVTLPVYDLAGIYSYTINEVDTNKAGVEYLKDTLYLNVTVITNQETSALEVAGIAVHKGKVEGEKIDEFENKYTAGSLKISKTVTGNLGDRTKDFEFTVTFNAPKTGDELDVVNAIITVATPEGQDPLTTPATPVAISDWTDGKATKTFTLKHGQSVTFENIPQGVTYTVEETSVEALGYTTTATGDEGTIANAELTAAFTNDKGAIIDTGIELETLPFVLLMGIALVGVMALRRREDY